MKSRTCLMLWFALSLAATGLETAVAQAQVGSDVIHLVTGRQTRGRITKISATQVEYELRGSSQTVPVNEIRNISFSQEPTQLRRVRDMVREGQMQDALFSLSQIDPTKYREFVQTDVEFYRAYCQARMAIDTGKELPQVAKAMVTFYNENPNSHHHYAAAESLGDLAMALSKYAHAARYYSELSNAPWSEMKMRGLHLEARALRSEGKNAEALEKYETVIASSNGASRSKVLAEIGRAACQVEAGQSAGAIETIERIINQNDSKDSELFAHAYNALGAGYRQKDQTMDAIMAYLHVDLLFYQIPDAHAEALYYLSQLWDQVKKPERAVAARSLLKSRYPASRWAQL